MILIDLTECSRQGSAPSPSSEEQQHAAQGFPTVAVLSSPLREKASSTHLHVTCKFEGEKYRHETNGNHLCRPSFRDGEYLLQVLLRMFQELAFCEVTRIPTVFGSHPAGSQ